jgi:hypothetical protein
MLKEAAETVPAVVGKVTPPVVERTPPGVITTVPAVPLVARLPKLRFEAFVIASGVTMVAAAVAVADTEACPNEFAANPATTAKTKNNFLMTFFFKNCVFNLF